MAPMSAKQIGRRVLLVLAGVVALLLSPSYRGPWAAVAHSYGGNFAASSAV